MMSRRLAIAALAVSGMIISVTNGQAATWPASIVGTWNGTSNQTSVVVTVQSQDTLGKCKNISGTMHDVGSNQIDGLTGYYCPGSGAVVFMRSAPGSIAPFQVYSASLSQSPAPNGLALMMSGAFGEYSAVGALGQYSFAVFH